jgi:hypothetical protein
VLQGTGSSTAVWFGVLPEQQPLPDQQHTESASHFPRVVLHAAVVNHCMLYAAYCCVQKMW